MLSLDLILERGKEFSFHFVETMQPFFIILLLLACLNALSTIEISKSMNLEASKSERAADYSVIVKQAEIIYERFSQRIKPMQIPEQLVEKCKALDGWFRKSLQYEEFKKSVLTKLDSPMFRPEDVRLFKERYFSLGLVRRQRWNLLDALVISMIINCAILPAMNLDSPLLQFLVYFFSFIAALD